MIKRLLIICLFFPLIYSCETIVDVKLDEVEDYLVVDAWLTHTAEDQKIRLTLTQPYYDNSYAAGVTNAQVTVADDAGNTFVFDHQGDGNYVWAATDTFGVVGRTYFLEVVWGSNSYTAFSRMNRVPKIDSITYTFEEGDSFTPDYYYSEFFGTDPVGEGDAYWLKAWRNGKYLNEPSEIYLFYDASFGEGNGDGIPFIYPIRTIANPFEQDLNAQLLPPYSLEDTIYASDKGEFELNGSTGTLEDNKLVLELERNKPLTGGVKSYVMDGMPYSVLDNSTIIKKADSVYLELHSITDEAWFFLLRLQEETNRPGGFGALFATPPANLPTNIQTEGDVKVAGFFSVSNVSAKGRKLTEDAIREQPTN